MKLKEMDGGIEIEMAANMIEKVEMGETRMNGKAANGPVAASMCLCLLQMLNPVAECTTGYEMEEVEEKIVMILIGNLRVGNMMGIFGFEILVVMRVKGQEEEG